MASLPTGSIFGVNAKAISVGVFLSVFLLYLITDRDGLTFSDMFFITFVGVFLILSALIAILKGQRDVSQMFYQLRDIASTVFISWLSIFFIRRGVIRPESLIRVVIFSVCALSILKFALITESFVSNLNIVEATEKILGEGSFVTGSIALGVFRMEFSADILCPFALFALLAPSVSGVRFGWVSKVLILSIMLISGFIGFSRYIWMLFAVAIIAATVVEKTWKAFAVVVLIASGLGFFASEFFGTAIQSRFASDDTRSSDEIRVEQSKALTQGVLDNLVLGSGAGTHANAVIRSDKLRYSYELQWLALLMQFGIVGMIVIVLLVIASLSDSFKAKHPGKLWVLLLFFLWLGSASTNPYMTTSFAGVTFALFMALFYRMRNVAVPAQLASIPLAPSPQS